MRQRSFIVVAIAVAVLVFGAVGVYAYDKTRDDVSRTVRAVTGGSVHSAVPVTISYSRPAVDRFAAAVKRKIDRAPRDANIDVSGGQVVKVDSQEGREVNAGALEREVGAELTQVTSDHRVKAPV